MAEETQQKRLREELSHEKDSVDGSSSNNKRYKPYNNILSLLDEDEEEECQEPSREPSRDDLSAIYKTLQRELSSDSDSTTTFDFDSLPLTEPLNDDGDVEYSVMRHLLEASDDELGIPNIINGGNNIINDSIINNNKDSDNDNVPPFASFTDINYGFWEFEDEAANYYTALQSQLFM